MSGHRYISNASSLFDDDDVDDETFLRNARPRPGPQSGSSMGSGPIGDLERQRQAMLERQREIEQRTIDSSSRSIGLLRDSEQIGIATAEELVRQREQLQNTNKRLDDINTNLRFSQKHLNGIKSVFYGLKNYISGKSDTTPVKSVTSPSDSNVGVPGGSRLESTIDDIPRMSSSERYDTHPSTRLRGLQEQAMVAPQTDSQRVNEILDANLDEMVQAITRLKGLGSALGEEIDAQNELIDNIQDKVEVADITIGKQNKQMNKLLGK